MVIGRKKKQDLTEVFKICKGFSRIRPEKLFHFDDRGSLKVQEVTLLN